MAFAMKNFDIILKVNFLFSIKCFNYKVYNKYLILYFFNVIYKKYNFY